MKRERHWILPALAALLLGLTASATWAADGTMFIRDDNVGIGTSTPSSKLTIRETDGTAQLLIIEKLDGTNVLARFRNDGPIRFQFEETLQARTWSTTYYGGKIVWNLQPTSGIEMRLRSNGNLRIKGTLSQGSSRAIKQGIVAVEPRQVLDKVLRLPIAEWSYRSDDPELRHLGPMAESFHATFGLGDDDKHLAPADAAGVALAAIQGVYEVVQEKDTRIAELESENAALAARLARLEAAVATLLD